MSIRVEILSPYLYQPFPFLTFSVHSFSPSHLSSIIISQQTVHSIPTTRRKCDVSRTFSTVTHLPCGSLRILFTPLHHHPCAADTFLGNKFLEPFQGLKVVMQVYIYRRRPGQGIVGDGSLLGPNMVSRLTHSDFSIRVLEGR